jgi:hypothetical protein
MYAEPGQPSPNSDRALEALEARLRTLPAPAVPGDLEARLLSAIPAEMPTLEQVSGSRRRWMVWAGLAGALAAACLLIVLSWPRNNGSKINIVKHDEDSSGNSDIPPRPESRHDLDTMSAGTFTWPLAESSPMLASTAIPPDLLD